MLVCDAIQAFVGPQSELITHSGRHPLCGSPRYSGKHEHTARLFITLHSVLSPHGLGRHGFLLDVFGVSCEKQRIPGFPVKPGLHVQTG